MTPITTTYVATITATSPPLGKRAKFAREEYDDVFERRRRSLATRNSLDSHIVGGASTSSKGSYVSTAPANQAFSNLLNGAESFAGAICLCLGTPVTISETSSGQVTASITETTVVADAESQTLYVKSFECLDM